MLCATAWMHGVFASQLTIGNTSFHKLFSVSRDGYNITRTSGLRVLAEIDGAWRLLTLPSRFEMGLSDSVWEYRHEGGAISVHVIASGEDPALQCTIEVEGAPCRFLVFGHLVLGEQGFCAFRHRRGGRPRRSRSLSGQTRTGFGGSAIRMPPTIL